MGTFIKKPLLTILSFALLSFAFSSKHNENKALGIVESYTPCVSVYPFDLTFGLRGTPDAQNLNVSMAGTWSAYTNSSWMKINGGYTISSGGNATISVTVNPTIVPPGVPYYCGGTITTGYIVFYQGSGCGGNLSVPVSFIVCPCC